MNSSSKCGRRPGPLSRRSSSKASDSETKSRPNTPLEQQQKTPSKSKDKDVLNSLNKSGEKLSSIVEKNEPAKKATTEKTDNGVASKTKDNTKSVKENGKKDENKKENVKKDDNKKENGKKDDSKKEKVTHAIVRIEKNDVCEENGKEAAVVKKENEVDVPKTESVVEEKCIEEKVEEIIVNSSTVTATTERSEDVTESNDAKKPSEISEELKDSIPIDVDITNKANNEYSDLKLVISSDDDAVETDVLLLEESSDAECKFEDCSPKFSPKISRSKTRRSQTKVVATPETPQPKKFSALFDTSPELMIISEEINTKVLRYSGKYDIQTTQEDDNIEKELIEMENGRQSPEKEAQLKPKSETPEIKFVNSALISPFRRSARIQESMVANYSGNTSRDYSISSYATRASDTSRNYEDSLNDSNRGNGSSFGLTLRGISGRKSVRPLREMSFQNSMQKKKIIEKSKPLDYNEVADNTQLSMNVTVGSEIDEDYLVTCETPEVRKSMKRSRSITPEEDSVADHVKRQKVSETKSGFMSYVPSPMTALRSKFSRSQINSSTPIVNRYSYKTKEVNQTSNVSSITSSNDNANPEIGNGDESNRKWCSIM